MEMPGPVVPQVRLPCCFFRHQWDWQRLWRAVSWARFWGDRTNRTDQQELLGNVAYHKTEKDFLNFSGVADTVAEIITQAVKWPTSICISGTWGAGKSSMIKRVRPALAEKDQNDPEEFIYVEFNIRLPWKLNTTPPLQNIKPSYPVKYRERYRQTASYHRYHSVGL